MIDPGIFLKTLLEKKIEFFAGVPDSILRNFTEHLFQNVPEKNHVIAANEGLAVSTAAGYQIASGKIPLVYMQNAGLGNIINPIVSLCHSSVYKIPLLLLIGWRGHPQEKDEPQHEFQGRITQNQLNLLEIPTYEIGPNSDYEEVINEATLSLSNLKTSHAILVRKDSFSSLSQINKNGKSSRESRYDVINKVNELARLENFPILVTTGKASRETFEINENLKNQHTEFLMVGSMGHLSSLALGLSKGGLNKKIVCLDGDGAFMMHLGGIPNLTSQKDLDLFHIILNNEIHESVGSLPTNINKLNLDLLAGAMNYKYYQEIITLTELSEIWNRFKNTKGSFLINFRISNMSNEKLMRPNITLTQLKSNFIEKINQSND